MGLCFLHWVMKTNVPRCVVASGYQLKWYVLLQLGHHQFMVRHDMYQVSKGGLHLCIDGVNWYGN